MGLELEDIRRDPTKFGFCSFADFRKDPSKWRPDPEQVFKCVQDAGIAYRDYWKKIKYKIGVYECKTLGQVQRICKEMGIQERHLTFHPELINTTGDQCDVEITFFEKKRENW